MSNEELKFRQAILRGAELMKEHGLSDWKIKIHSKRRVLGDCSDVFKTIRFSRHFLKVADKETFDAVALHEIAHALVGNKHGHNEVFKAKCREISLDKVYDKPSSPDKLKTYVHHLKCPTCGIEGGKNRLGYKPPRCAPCARKGIVSEFEVTKNIVPVNVW